MVLEISRREVLNNLIRFKDSLLEKQAKKHPKGRRVYKVLLNRKTGDMRFPQKIRALEYTISKRKGREGPEEWKEIQIIVSQEAEIAHFDVQDAHSHRLEPTDLDPLAWRVTRETLEILNEKAKEVKEFHSELLPEEAVLKDLSSIHLAIPVDQIEDLPGWVGALSRVDAEKRLKGKAIGTYLFREGGYLTFAIAFHLAEENHLSVHPFLLTFVEGREKIAELLLLKTGRGWIYYRDDPNLSNFGLYQYHASPQALIHEMGHLIKHPISRGGF